MRTFVHLAKTYHFSLRVIEQCFTEINLILRTTPPNTRIFPFLIALLVAMKAHKPASYDLLLGTLSKAEFQSLTDELKQELDINDRIYKWTLSQFEAYLICGYSETEDAKTELLAVLNASAVSQNPMERSYAQQALRFVVQIQTESSAAIKNLVSQISLLQTLSIAS
jgi:hypothetical protein